MKAFIVLGVPATHPFWTSEEAPLPVLPSPHPVPAAHMIMVHSRRSPSHTYALASGQYAGFVLRHSAEKYGKLAYSSAFGFCVPTGSYGLEQNSPDCTLALSDDVDVVSGNGNNWRVRRTPLNASLIEEHSALYAQWDAWKDVDVQTWVVPLSEGDGDWHLRAHQIVTKTREIWTCDGGFSLHGQSSVGSNRRLSNWDEEHDEGIQTTSSPQSASALVRSSMGTSGIISLSNGLLAEPRVLNLPPNSSIMFPHALLPAICHRLAPRDEPYWIFTAVFAVVGHTTGDPSWKSSWELGPKLEIPDWLQKIAVGSR